MNLQHLMRPALLALGLTMTIATNAMADTKKDLVQRLLQLQRPGIELAAKALAEQPVANILQNSRVVLLARVPPDKREAAGKAAEAEVKKYLDETVPLMRDRAWQLAPSVIGTALEERFSEEELRQLINWIESPLARKFQQVAPELQGNLTKALIAEMRPVIEPKFKALDTAVAKALGMPVQPAASGASAPKKGTN